jgi:hypothetical protein
VLGFHLIVTLSPNVAICRGCPGGLGIVTSKNKGLVGSRGDGGIVLAENGTLINNETVITKVISLIKIFKTISP